jgi:hypothetical protein
VCTCDVVEGMHNMHQLLCVAVVGLAVFRFLLAVHSDCHTHSLMSCRTWPYRWQCWKCLTYQDCKDDSCTVCLQPAWPYRWQCWKCLTCQDWNDDSCTVCLQPGMRKYAWLCWKCHTQVLHSCMTCPECYRQQTDKVFADLRQKSTVSNVRRSSGDSMHAASSSSVNAYAPKSLAPDAQIQGSGRPTAVANNLGS